MDWNPAVVYPDENRGRRNKLKVRFLFVIPAPYQVRGKLQPESSSIKAASNNVIPAKAGIQKPLKSLDPRLPGSDKLIIIRGSLKDEIRCLHDYGLINLFVNHLFFMDEVRFFSLL